LVTFRTARAYAFSKTHRQRRFSILIILGIAIGMAALIIIIGIMNSLQNSQISKLRDVETFDIRITGSSLDTSVLDAIPGVDLAFSYLDVQALAMNTATGRSTYIRIRGIEDDLLQSRRFSSSVYAPGHLDSSLLPGSRLASSLGLTSSSNLKVTFLKKGNTARLVPYTALMKLGMAFISDSSDFSSSTCLTGLSELEEESGFSQSEIGIYLEKDKDLDRVMDAISALDPNAVVSSWKTENSALYSALLLEKYMVIGFLGFIILIVSYYLKRSTVRMIDSKKKESAALRALGMTRLNIVMVFLVQALQISLMGIGSGIVLGLIVSKCLTQILRFIDSLARLFTGRGTILAAYPFSVTISAGEIASFSAAILICTLAFSFAGAAKAFKIDIMEILKDDSRN